MLSLCCLFTVSFWPVWFNMYTVCYWKSIVLSFRLLKAPRVFLEWQVHMTRVCFYSDSCRYICPFSCHLIRVGVSYHNGAICWPDLWKRVFNQNENLTFQAVTVWQTALHLTHPTTLVQLKIHFQSYTLDIDLITNKPITQYVLTYKNLFQLQIN